MCIGRSLEWELRKGMLEPMEETAFHLDLKESGRIGRRTLQRLLGVWGGDIQCKENNARNELLGFSFSDARANSPRQDILHNDLSLLFILCF